MSVFNKERTLNAFDVDPEDPSFLKAEDHTFLFFGATHSEIRMLCGKKENYTAGTITFKEVGLKPTDLMGQRCFQCKKPVEEVHTSCIGIHQNHVKQLLHETCFSKWFASQDKEKLKPYRFCRPRKRSMMVEGSSFKIQINNGEKLDEYAFSGLSDVPFSSIAALAPADASGVGSMVPAPPLASSGPGTSVEPGMSGWGAGVAAGSGGQGMTMAGGSVPMPSMAPASVGASGGITTQTMIICPHCSQPMMLSFEAKKI